MFREAVKKVLFSGRALSGGGGAGGVKSWLKRNFATKLKGEEMWIKGHLFLRLLFVYYEINWSIIKRNWKNTFLAKRQI